MSRTLNLVDRLLSRARTYQQYGRQRDALEVLVRLARFRDLADEVREEIHLRLAEIQLQRRRLIQACRHVSILLRLSPKNGRYHQLLGNALRQRDNSHWERAVHHYERALEFNGERSEILADLGLLRIRLGQLQEGLNCLREAVELKPDDAVLLEKLIKGLRWANQPDEARGVLRTALFRNRFHPRFLAHWEDFQFRETRHQQLRQKRAAKRSREEVEGPVLLPFLRPVRSNTERLRDTLLHEGTITVPAPHLRRSARNAEQRNVQ